MLIDLRPIYQVIEVSGNDAAIFLQGQLTCDLTQLDNQVTWGAHCNVKGRVVALFRLFKHDDGFMLIVSHGLADKLIKTLQRYVFRAKVSLSLTDYGCYGLLQHDIADCPEGYYVKQHNDYVVGLPGQRILRLSHQAPDTLQPDANTWQQTAIAHNEPHLYPETSEVFLPNELGLDALGGVSLTKGCYIGQEIIARLHYLGKAKKGVYQVTHESFAEPGTALYQQSKAVGQIITSAKTHNGYVSLASLKTDLTPPLYLDASGQSLVSLHHP